MDNTVKSSQIVFLTYISRSGSTLLAKMLDEFQDIGVTIEAVLPDGIKNRRSFNASCIEKLDSELKRLFADEKFREWNIDRSTLRSLLAQETYPLGFDKLLPVLLSQYFARRKAKIYVFKAAPYRGSMLKLREIFPGCRFIHILRDPRAVYRSQRTTPHSLTGEPMLLNPVAAGRGFAKMVNLLSSFEDATWLHVVRYEDLVTSPDEIISGILSFLEINNAGKTNEKNYVDRIPAKQKRLHANVNSSLMEDRIDAWRDQLTNLQIVAIQEEAKAEMRRWNYHCIDINELTVREMLVGAKYRVQYFAIAMASRLMRISKSF